MVTCLGARLYDRSEGLGHQSPVRIETEGGFHGKWALSPRGGPKACDQFGCIG